VSITVLQKVISFLTMIVLTLLIEMPFLLGSVYFAATMAAAKGLVERK